MRPRAHAAHAPRSARLTATLGGRSHSGVRDRADEEEEARVSAAPGVAVAAVEDGRATSLAAGELGRGRGGGDGGDGRRESAPPHARWPVRPPPPCHSRRRAGRADDATRSAASRSRRAARMLSVLAEKRRCPRKDAVQNASLFLTTPFPGRRGPPHPARSCAASPANPHAGPPLSIRRDVRVLPIKGAHTLPVSHCLHSTTAPAPCPAPRARLRLPPSLAARRRAHSHASACGRARG